MAITLVVAFVVEMRLPPLEPDPARPTPPAKLERLERERRAALAGFAAGGVIAVACSVAGVVVSEVADGRYVHPELAVRLLLAPAVTGTLFLAPMIVALTLIPRRGARRAGPQPARRLAALRSWWGSMRDRLRALRLVVLPVVAAIPAVLLTPWLLWALPPWVVWSTLRHPGREDGAEATVKQPFAGVTFAALTTAGLAAMIAPALTLGAPRGDSAQAVTLYGLGASGIAALLVVFAAGHPLREADRPPTRGDVAWWGASAAVGTSGLVAALWGSAAEGGPFAFWGTVLGPVVLVAALVRYSATPLLSRSEA